MKRRYVEPGARNHGIGRHLATAFITEARQRGYKRFNPVPDAVFMQLRL